MDWTPASSHMIQHVSNSQVRVMQGLLKAQQTAVLVGAPLCRWAARVTYCCCFWSPFCTAVYLLWVLDDDESAAMLLCSLSCGVYDLMSHVCMVCVAFVMLQLDIAVLLLKYPDCFNYFVSLGKLNVIQGE